MTAQTALNLFAQTADLFDREKPSTVDVMSAMHQAAMAERAFWGRPNRNLPSPGERQQVLKDLNASLRELCVSFTKAATAIHEDDISSSGKSFALLKQENNIFADCLRAMADAVSRASAIGKSTALKLNTAIRAGTGTNSGIFGILTKLVNFTRDGEINQDGFPSTWGIS